MVAETLTYKDTATIFSQVSLKLNVTEFIILMLNYIKVKLNDVLQLPWWTVVDVGYYWSGLRPYIQTV